jgi:hypothetical protein
MSIDKLILNKTTTLEDVAKYFKDLSPDKQVRARELGDGRIQLYVRKDSHKQFFTDKLKPDFLVRRDYLSARNAIFDIASGIKDNPKKSAILFHVRKLLDNHRHDFFVNELNQSTKAFLDPQNNPKTAWIRLKTTLI